MNAPEDRLRELLQAGEPQVGAGSFDDVRHRAGRLARRSRAARIGAGVVAALALVGVAVPLLGDDDPGQQVIAEPGPTTSTVPTTTIPATSEPYGIWPFVTAAQADDEEIELPFNPTEANEVAQEFLRRFADMDVAVEPTTSLGHEVRSVSVVATTRVRETTVTLRRIGSSDRWTVVGAHGDGLVIEAPLPGGFVSDGAVAVLGKATAFEGTVAVRVLDRGDEPTELGRAVLTGEQGEMKPFSGTVPVALDDSGRGVVIAVTESAEDGSVEQVAAVAVRWDPDAEQAPAASSLVAVLNREVVGDPGEQDVVVLSEDGSVERTLLEGFSVVEGGVLDAELAPDGRSVVVALSTSACTSELRSIPLDGSAPRSLGPGNRLAISPDGRRIAVAYDVDCNGSDELEVRALGAPAGAGQAVEGQIAMLTWADHGTVVYDIRGQDGGALIVRDADSGDERALDGRWSLPLGRGEGVVQVLVTERGGAYLGDVDPATGRLLGAGAQVPADVVDHTLVGVEPCWLTKDGVLHGFGRILRRDVALVAS